VIFLDLLSTFLISALFSGLIATSSGGVPILFIKRSLHRRSFDLMNGFAAGLMLAASVFSLLIPGLELGGLIPTSLGFLVGVAFILLLKDRVHIFYYKLRGQSLDKGFSKAIIIFIALTLHNMPEGLSVGVAFASGSLALGFSVALAIGIQNIPEGFAVAAPLFKSGYSRKKAFMYSVFSGVVEPINAVLGYILVSQVVGMLPYAFGFCAGAMMFVVINEMIPEAQHDEYLDKSTLSIMFGFLVMFILDKAL